MRDTEELGQHLWYLNTHPDYQEILLLCIYPEEMKIYVQEKTFFKNAKAAWSFRLEMQIPVDRMLKELTEFRWWNTTKELKQGFCRDFIHTYPGEE